MGILSTHKKSNYETISTEKREYEGYTVAFKLQEYDLYERILWMRDEHLRESVVIKVYESDSVSVSGTAVTPSPIITKRYAWRKEAGPHGGLEYQIQMGWVEVKNEIDERLKSEESLGNAVEELGLDE